jgi:hypothetical protein
MKVSRKVWRRSRKHTSSSVSRRRLRNKNKKSGYRKKNAKTQKGGKRGRGYKRMRAHTHKRGKRFHRGGMFGKDNKPVRERSVFALPPIPNNIELREFVPPSKADLLTGDEDPNFEIQPTLTPPDIPQNATAPPPTRIRRLPKDLLNPSTPSKPQLNKAIYFKLDDPVSLEYKKDFIPGGSEPNKFDVFIHVQRGLLPCILLRHDSNDPLKYDRRMSIEIDKLRTGLPYIDITATDPYTDKPKGTYNFPLTTTNTESFKTIKSAAIESV